MFKEKWSEDRIKQLQKEGRGRGEGENYIPWILVKDFSSTGLASRIKGIKSNRVHHVLSKIENRIFHAAEWQTDVIDIREQYPLPREETQEIAKQLGIKHPCYPRTTVPLVITVDFLVTCRRGVETVFKALDAKDDSAADDKRKIEILEIAREYCERKNWEHRLIFGSQIPVQKIKNIEYIRESMTFTDDEYTPDYYGHHLKRMVKDIACFNERDTPLFEYCVNYEERAGLEQAEGLRLAKLLMFERILKPDLSSKNLAREPLSTFVVTGQLGSLRLVGGM